MKRYTYPVLLILIALLVTAGTALAQGTGPDAPGGDAVTDDAVNAIAKQLYCPVCENIPLDVCGTQACEQWRQLIREKLAQGWTEAQIKQYFVDQYGDRVLATPPAHGLNWLVYIVPPVAILAGAFLLYRAFKSWQAPPPSQQKPTQATPPADEYVARMEEELSKR